MAQPDFLICLECESPVYVFEWEDGRVAEIVCPMCGNDDLGGFATEEELDELSMRGDDEDGEA